MLHINVCVYKKTNELERQGGLAQDHGTDTASGNKKSWTVTRPWVVLERSSTSTRSFTWFRVGRYGRLSFSPKVDTTRRDVSPIWQVLNSNPEWTEWSLRLEPARGLDRSGVKGVDILLRRFDLLKRGQKVEILRCWDIRSVIWNADTYLITFTYKFTTRL